VPILLQIKQLVIENKVNMTPMNSKWLIITKTEYIKIKSIQFASTLWYFKS
jgi:hypothetical protein